jgi:hypothetical protein
MKAGQNKSVTNTDRLNPSKDGRSRMLCVQDYRSTADSFACGKQSANALPSRRLAGRLLFVLRRSGESID